MGRSEKRWVGSYLSSRESLGGRPIERVIRGRITPPPLPARLISRPRVEHLLARLIDDYPVACVYATAGAGKTTAVLQAARATNRPLVWFSADQTDSATGRLLTYLEAAIALQVSEVAGVAAAALAARVPHSEVAGLLAEAIGNHPVLIVFDDLERLAKAEPATVVLGSFLRFLPETARVVLVGRVEPNIDLGAAAAMGRVAAVGEAELAFTLDEVSEALSAAGRSDIDADAALSVTCGWVAGVLFEAWRSADHVPGVGGEADPLHGYLASQILDELEPAEREFLICTSVLDQVTPSAAEALGLEDARARFHTLRARHLPVSWDRHGHAMRYHPRFREYLLERLSRWSARDVEEIRRRHGVLLAENGHYEEAVEEFLQAGDLDRALAAAERCCESVIDRADLDIAEQWLARLAPVREGGKRLATAELMLALGKEQYSRAVELADRLAAAGDRDALAQASSRAGSVMAWCYMHAGRLSDTRAVLELTAPGSPREAMLYCLSLMGNERPAAAPTHMLSGDSFDALVIRVHYYRGFFPLMEAQLSGWAGRLAGSWKAGAMLAMGRIEEALHGFEEARNAPAGGGLWVTGVLGPALMARLGRVDEAWQFLLEGRKRFRSSGSVMMEMFNYIEEADLELRVNRDAWAAQVALSVVLNHPVGQNYAFVAEMARTRIGHMLLLQNNDAEAAEHLRAVVESAQHADRVLCLANAGVYLAEAEWRLGNEEAADRAADVALAAAERQGSSHLLLEALSEFPAVLSRRLDAEPAGEARWHQLARCLAAQRVPVTGRLIAKVVLGEFGHVSITVDGIEVKPRIKKSYELLAYLASRSTSQVTKQELLDALFDGRGDESASAYLRQAVLRLRQVLPDEVALDSAAGTVRLGGDVSVVSESVRFEDILAEASQLRGEDRFAGLMRALNLFDKGEYLPGLTSSWVESRRGFLAQRAVDARYDAAEAAYGCALYKEAQTLVDQTIAADPFRESAWRLAMRIAQALGDEHRVLLAFRSCEEALAEIGASPSSATRQLFCSLRD